MVTAGNDQTARIWDAESGAELETLRGHESSVDSAAFSPDGERRGRPRATDATARIWDAESGAELASLRTSEASSTAPPSAPTASRW